MKTKQGYVCVGSINSDEDELKRIYEKGESQSDFEKRMAIIKPLTDAVIVSLKKKGLL